MTIETHNTNPIKTTKPHRWFRFRLRTLLIMITLMSVPLGWVGWELDQRRKEKATIAWVEKMGGKVSFNSLTMDERNWWEKKKDKWLGKRVALVGLDANQVIELSPLVVLKKLEFVSLTNPQVTDLSSLAGLNKLKRLDLSDTQVSDLSPLSGLKNLAWLDLNGTPVTDLSPLVELKNLEYLDLNDTRVSDLSPLVELQNLETLGLSTKQVKDLSPLAELKNLHWLYLSDTPVNKEQVEELRLALPNCDIRY